MEVEWARGDERQSTTPLRGVEDLSRERAREEEIMESAQKDVAMDEVKSQGDAKC